MNNLKHYIYLLVFASIFFVSCEDNLDKDSPLLGKWRSDRFVANVETNDSVATSIIIQDIERASNKGQQIMQYSLMTDSIFVLYNINNDYMATGSYFQRSDTIYFKEKDSCYWGVSIRPKHFEIYKEDISHWYTSDSLSRLGVKNPETIIVKHARLFELYKWISS